MTAVPAATTEEQVPSAESSETGRESGEFSIEKTLAENGVEGLKLLAAREVDAMSERIGELAAIDPDAVSVAKDESEALGKAKVIAINALNAAKDSLVRDLTGEVKTAIGIEKSAEAALESAKAELLAEKKKLFLEKSGKELSEKGQELLTPAKAKVEEAAAAVEAMRPPEPAEGLSPEEAERLGFLGMKTDDAVDREFNELMREAGVLQKEGADDPAIEIPEADPSLEIEHTISPEAAAAKAMDVPAGRENAQEELAQAEAGDPLPGIDYEPLIADERKKQEAVAQDYQDAQKALQDFRRDRPGNLTPIEQKYVSALEAQLEMDRLGSAQIENQIALYEVNAKIEALSSDESASDELDKLIELRDAKDRHSYELAAQYAAAVAAHDRILEEYESSLESFEQADAAEDQEPTSEDVEEDAAEHDEEIEEGDTELSTGASMGGANFERGLYLTPEDEANFEARQAGVKQGKRGSGVLESAASAMKDLKKATTPQMKLSGGGAEKEAPKEKKKGGKFFRWLFSSKWFPWQVE